MSNFTIDAGSTFTELFINANLNSNNSLAMMLLIVFFVINLSSLISWGVKKSLLVSLFNSAIISVIFLAIGVFTSVSFTFVLFIAFVGCLIWIMVTGSD